MLYSLGSSLHRITSSSHNLIVSPLHRYRTAKTLTAFTLIYIDQFSYLVFNYGYDLIQSHYLYNTVLHHEIKSFVYFLIFSFLFLDREYHRGSLETYPDHL